MGTNRDRYRVKFCEKTIILHLLVIWLGLTSCSLLERNIGEVVLGQLTPKQMNKKQTALPLRPKAWTLGFSPAKLFHDAFLIPLISPEGGLIVDAPGVAD